MNSHTVLIVATARDDFEAMTFLPDHRANIMHCGKSGVNAHFEERL
jgi:hypothetical protein